MRIALSRYKPAIPIIGNSPTALVEVLRLIRKGVEVPHGNCNTARIYQRSRC